MPSNRDRYREIIERYRRVAFYALAGVCFGAALVYGGVQSGVIHHTKVPTPSTEVSAKDNATTTEAALAASEPTHIRIPAAHIDADFEEPLGLDASGAVGVPDSFEKVGWYKYGPTPGELGPAVVIGHVDSYRGPAVFYSLGQVSEGDEVYIDRADGTTAVFKVIGYERILQSEFPTEKVYGNLNYPGLRLITCTGTYSHSTKRYSKNLIVYARLDHVEGE